MQFQQICSIFISLLIISETYGYCACGTFDKTATSEVKSIHSPNYPGSYCNELNCIYTITADEGYRILVNLSVIETESSYDHLNFFDGSSTGSNVLVRYSGKYAYNQPLIKSSSNYLTIQFKTDPSNVDYKGFMLQFVAVRDGEQTNEEKEEETESQEDCECEKQIYNSNETSGEIKSPGYPGTVCNTATYCLYEIEGNASFELNVVLTVQIKYSYKLTIYQIMQYEERQIQRKSHIYTSTGSKINQLNFAKNVGVRIVLEYDDSVLPLTDCGWACQLPTKTAFTAVFNRVRKDLSCPYPLIAVARNPNHITFSLSPDGTMLGETCDLMFLTESGMRIKIQIKKPAYCRATFVQFENSTEIKQDGNNEYSDEADYGFESETNEMTIKAQKTYGNCQLQVTYTASDTDCKCSDKPRLLFENNATVTHLSPGFPYSFCPRLECNDEFKNNLTIEENSGNVKAFLLTWNDFQITANLQQNLQLNVKLDNGIWTGIRYRIVVNVTEVDTESFNDFLKLYDGNSTEDELIEKFSGHRLRLPLVNSTSNFLTIRFHSDKDIVEKGFALSYWAEPLSPGNANSLSNLTDKLSSSHLSIISVLLFICITFGAVSTIFGILLLRKSTRSLVTRREEL